MKVSDVVTKDDWMLTPSRPDDIDDLMDWFPRQKDVVIWGGPTFRYPFTRETFFEDIYWGRMATYSLRNPSGVLAAFGQAYERIGRINFARLVVNPAMRGRGVGKRLVETLMIVSRDLFRCAEYSLFVFRENIPAYECYRSMGFVVTDYPAGVPHADVCYYLTRPVEQK